jgi:hypothetical protein
MGTFLGLHGEIKAARPTGFVFMSVQYPPILHGNQCIRFIFVTQAN